jgi:phage tail sheath protein FI
MSLLRRVAVRRGAPYVFEPNGDVLRRAVERGFTQMLDSMFRQGAFGGRTVEEAFRVSVEPTAADRDGGRLIVEIGVAPSQPMRFLTVRLFQSGERFTIAEEA